MGEKSLPANLMMGREAAFCLNRKKLKGSQNIDLREIYNARKRILIISNVIVTIRILKKKILSLERKVLTIDTLYSILQRLISCSYFSQTFQLVFGYLSIAALDIELFVWVTIVNIRS